MKDLLLIVPSRGRPHNIRRLWDAMRATCQGDTTLLVGLDADDEANYERIPGVEYEVRDGLRQVVAWLNALAVPRTGEYRLIGHIGDDNVPRTPGWDVAIIEALKGVPFAFGNDLYPREPGSLCCHVFTRSEVIDALGYFALPSLRHMWVDPVWMEWGKATGIAYLHKVVLEHMHYTAGKAPVDQSYIESTALIPKEEAEYRRYLADPDGLAADVRKIREALATEATPPASSAPS